jgi:hypothetical protein
MLTRAFFKILSKSDRISSERPPERAEDERDHDARLPVGGQHLLPEIGVVVVQGLLEEVFDEVGRPFGRHPGGG